MNSAKLRMPGGGVAIVCGTFPRVKACRCGIAAPFLCDWKVGTWPTGRGNRTCDAPICASHAFELEPEKHLCPTHQAAYVLWLQQQGIVYP